jgi:hypothetical protein
VKRQRSAMIKDIYMYICVYICIYIYRHIYIYIHALQASVKRQRSAMIKDKEKLDFEHEKLRLKTTDYNEDNVGLVAPLSPNAMADLRFKLRVHMTIFML